MQDQAEDLPSRRIIEETFPVREVSQESVLEKGIRHGHISALHIWWARRPLAASRATAYAALLPYSGMNPKQVGEKRKFIVELSKWDNSSNRNILDKARSEINAAYDGGCPKVLDPFGGGGAIPLEALRLGCEVFSNDYNPVSVIMQKCTLEYPQRFGAVHRELENDTKLPEIERQNTLLDDIKKWSMQIRENAEAEIGHFFPKEKDGSIPVGYFWARTIPCPNPSCNAEIPLIRQYWLAKKPGKEVFFYPSISGKQISYKIAGDGYHNRPSNFDPSKGTISRGTAVCLICGTAVENKALSKNFRDGKAGNILIAVVFHKEGVAGKRYRVATPNDMKVFNDVSEYLEKKRQSLISEWGIDPVPDEPTPAGKGRGAERAFSVQNYNMLRWGDLFNSRQKLALITLTDKARIAHRQMLRQGYSEDYAKAVVSYIALIISRCSDFASNVVTWLNHVENTGHTFTRQAIPMAWDYFELNLFSPSSQGTFNSMFNQSIKTIKFLTGVKYPKKAIVTQASATSLPFEDAFFDAVLTDPPYYDNVPYSYLSDFFYVWLKRSIGHLYPDLFSTPLTPKSQEIVAYSNREDATDGGKQFFEDMLKKAFFEIARVLKPNGIAVVVYAHKSTSGWETLLNSLLDSSLVVTAAWPINTEMKGRLRAMESAALASSIYMVARKLAREKTGFYREVKNELTAHLNSRLDRLWSEGVSGADFFIAAIGTSIEVFGKYQKIIDDEGNIIRADRFLEIVRTIVTDYAVHKILHNGFSAKISNRTRFYLLWRWSFEETLVPFDDARKLAQSIGIDLIKEWNQRNGFVQKEKEFVRVIGPEDRIELHELVTEARSPDLIDILHYALILWKNSRKSELVKMLKKTGYGNNDIFYRVAQAISETLSDASKEKKLLDGFLAGKERLSEEVRKDLEQKRLFE